jgi:hypothetical protein
MLMRAAIVRRTPVCNGDANDRELFGEVQIRQHPPGEEVRRVSF